MFLTNQTTVKILSILFLFTACYSGEWVPYSPDLLTGSQCSVEIKALHPTQVAVGYWEIEQRAQKVADKNEKKLQKYLEEHVGKIVIGPHGEPYLTDRHHLACIMARTGKSQTIFTTVEANFRNMSVDSFWIEMKKRKWVYLFDENGKGPVDPQLLPKTISELKDDPFRSVAWAVREEGGFQQTDIPFAEFQWADYFRSKLSIENKQKKMNISQLIDEAKKLCHNPEASKLPGFISTQE